MNAKEMGRIVEKKQKTEKEAREAIKSFGEQKKDEFWKKLNNDIRKEVEEKLRRILCEIKTNAEEGKTELLFLLGEERENRYDVRDSKAILEGICAKRIETLDTGEDMNIEYCFKEVFEEHTCDLRLNLLAEKLIGLIKKKGFNAQKDLSKYTEEGGWEDMSGQSFTWYLFGVKINW